MSCSTHYRQAMVLIACLLISGCGGDAYQYEPPNELKPGPGLFSGEDGEFNIIGEGKKEEADDPEEAAN